MRVIYTSLLVLCFAIPVPLIGQSNLAQKIHEFDFWLGEWNVYNKGDDTIRAYSHIESIIDSLAIQENYQVLKGKFKGKSFNKYNPVLDQWEQFWVDNSGTSLFITGGLDNNGRMVLGNEQLNTDGKRTWNEISWKLLEDGTVNQIWRTKKEGEEWQIVFDGIYKRKRR